MSRAFIKSSILSAYILLLCCAKQSYGQANIIGPNSVNNILYNRTPQISSPNAAALEKYVEFPTVAHTGVPDISLPLYEIGIKGIQLPIALSYHAGGIKVDEVSSDVGTGWSLSAGGAISIIPNGMLDEVSGFPQALSTANFNKIKSGLVQSGYGGGVINCMTAILFADPINPPDAYGIYSGNDIEMLGGVIKETYDTEPDIYTFQFPGGSGKFFMDENFNFRTMPYSEMRIERILVGGQPAGYTITDGSGNIFEFKIRESSNEVQTSSTNTFFPSQKRSFTYYLSKITNPQSEVIEFYYSLHYYTYDLQKTFSRSRTGKLTPCWQLNTSGSYFNNTFTYGSMMVDGQRLDSIKTSNGALVKFGYSTSDRTDLPGTKALEKVEFWQYLFERKKLKQYTLAHTYLSGRLVLNSVQEEGKPATTLSYNSIFPERLSYEQDHYGYYNGKYMNNIWNTLLPADEYMEFPVGADRSVVPEYAQAGMLTRITHPTGGYTEYIYGSNVYYLPTTTTKLNKALAYKVSVPDQTVSTTFTLPSGASNIKIEHNDTYDGTVIHNDYCIIHLTGPNNYSRDFVGTTQINGPVPLTLEPGLYTITIENVGTTYSAEVTISWFTEEQVPPHNEYGGGVRIEEIRKVDGANTTIFKKKFEYLKAGTSQSSGKTVLIPKYISTADPKIKFQGELGACLSMDCQLTVQSSSSNTPLGFANGSSVLYEEVSTWITETKTQGGYSWFKFNVADYGYNMGIPSFPYAPRIAYDWTNGSLLEQIDFAYRNGQYVKVKKVKNNYNYNEFDPVVHTTTQFKTHGIKVGIVTPPFICWSFCSVPNAIGTTFDPISFGIHPYKYYSSWHKLESTEETLYDENEQPALTSTTTYFQDNPASIQTTRIETSNSKGEKSSQRFKYAQDYASYGFAQYLLSRNAITTPIEKYNVVKNLANTEFVTGGEITTFKPSAILPDKVYIFETAAPVNISSFTASSMNSSGQLLMDAKYKERASFNAYNSIGNITELQQKDNVLQSYIWDYALSKPIAEVKGAAANQIAYTSFEADGMGGWEVNPGSTITTSQSYSGTRSFSGTIRKTVPTGNYTITLWANTGGAATVNSQAGTAGIIKGIWQLYTWNLTNVSLIEIASANMDEVRLFPRGAQMTTYTYDPLIGMTSQCDINNRLTYYEYDNNERLLRIRDADKNIIKQFDYQYQVNVSQEPVWQANGVTRCKPCPDNGAYLTNILQNQEINTNPNITVGPRWVDAGVSSSCVLTADWQNTTTLPRCKLINNINTGELEQEQKDMNPCSNTAGQFRWVTTVPNCLTCPKPGNWQPTGNTRCILVNGNYNGQTEKEERDIEPCSVNYNTTRWMPGPANPTACPIPCIPACNGPRYKCVGGACELGIKVCTDSYFDSGAGLFRNTFHYEFSDGSWSTIIVEYDFCDCPGLNCM